MHFPLHATIDKKPTFRNSQVDRAVFDAHPVCLQWCFGKVGKYKTVQHQIYVLLGMHKSGTTLVSEMLHKSGIPMVENDDGRGYDQGNHYERAATNALNKDLLACGERSSLKVTRTYFPGPEDADLRERAKREVALSSRDGEEAWGFKDPRTCLTYWFWADVLPPHRLICIYRDFAHVRAHYLSRKTLSPSRGLRALRAWGIYNTCMFEAYQSRQPDDRIMLNYETLMKDDGELARLQRFVGRPVIDRRRKSLNRQAGRPDTRTRAEMSLLRALWSIDVAALQRLLENTFEQERHHAATAVGAFPPFASQEA